MPTIVGSALADASGTALQDASAELLGEPDLLVTITSAGLLQEATWMAAGPWYEGLVGDIVVAVVAAVLGPSGPTLDQVNANIDEVREGIGQDGIAPYNVLEEVRYLNSNHEKNVQTVLDAIAALEPGGLTTEEHDQLLGLENVNYEQLVGDIWGYDIAVEDLRETLGGLQAQQVLENLWYGHQAIAGWQGYRAPHNPWFAFVAYNTQTASVSLGTYLNSSDPSILPSLDLSLAVAGDTVWSYLTREYPAFGWTRMGPGDAVEGSQVWLGTSGPTTVAGWRCLLTDADLAGIWREQEIPDPAAMDLPPVWPGAANVTLGDPVALVDQLHLVGTFDGVLVEVTTPPQHVGRRSLGGAIFDYSCGEIAFETDNGEIEPWQYLGFRSAIYVPKTMTQAAGARFRSLGGTEGTVTPWTKS